MDMCKRNSRLILGCQIVVMLAPLAVAGQTHESPLGLHFRPWSACLAGHILAPESSSAQNYDDAMNDAFEACKEEEAKFMADVPPEEREGLKEKVRSTLRVVWDVNQQTEHRPQ